MSFVNPYNFVRFRPMAAGARQEPVGHQAANSVLKSGQMTCRIVALSPIFIPSQDKEDIDIVPLPIDRRGRSYRKHSVYRKFCHYRDDPTPVIPGTSLKGTIRTVAEALVNGCVSQFSGTYPGRRQGELVLMALPEGYNLAVCDNHTQLCPTCRLFGMATGSGGDDKLFFKGKVAIDDARCTTIIDETNLSRVLLPELSTPKLYHKPFYVRPYMGKDAAAGRKFYYHRPDREIVEPDPDDNELLARLIAGETVAGPSGDGLWRTRSVVPLPEKTIFQFTITYHNLTEEELALLVQAVELRPNLATEVDEDGRVVPNLSAEKWVGPGVYHKIGYGKPAGLGSAAILIIEAQEFNWRARYGAASAAAEPLHGLGLHDWVQAYKQKFRADMNTAAPDQKPRLPSHTNDLFAILSWPRELAPLRYPRRENNEFATHILPAPGSEPHTGGNDG